MINIINLTPHNITISVINSENIINPLTYEIENKPLFKEIVIEPSGTIARLAEIQNKTGTTINNIPVVHIKQNNIVGLPEKKDGVVYVVSALVAQRAKDRDDVFFPYDAIRDSDGKIIGCKALGTYHEA